MTQSLTELMNDKGVRRKAPATPVLLKNPLTLVYNFFSDILNTVYQIGSTSLLLHAFDIVLS